MLLTDVEDIIAKMDALKAQGVGFSLDDFGTGYSSLSYLKRLPLDQLKIDKSFVRDILSDPNDAAIARTIVALAHSLGLAVVAEGVEDRGQLAFLLEHGCQTFQGYLFGHPVTARQFGEHRGSVQVVAQGGFDRGQHVARGLDMNRLRARNIGNIDGAADKNDLRAGARGRGVGELAVRLKEARKGARLGGGRRRGGGRGLRGGGRGSVASQERLGRRLC